MFLQNLRAKIGARLNGDSEAGFTLIELLVVMLILGILAAIALPAFFNQREKAGDAKAKETVHTAQVAIETFATENGGSYEGAASNETLHKIEPTLPEEGNRKTRNHGHRHEKPATRSPSNRNRRAVTRSPSKTKRVLLRIHALTEETGGCPKGGVWNNG